MLTAGQAAALIAAISFAVLAGAGVYALVKLARLISEASQAVAEMRSRTDLLLGRANAAVDQAHEQLMRTDAITANMDEVSSNIAELTADVSMLTGAVRTLLGGPLGRLAGLTYGVRRAIALRRAGPGAGPAHAGGPAHAAGPAVHPGDPTGPWDDARGRHLTATASSGPAALPPAVRGAPPAPHRGGEPAPAVPAQRRGDAGYDTSGNAGRNAERRRWGARKVAR